MKTKSKHKTSIAMEKMRYGVCRPRVIKKPGPNEKYKKVNKKR